MGFEISFGRLFGIGVVAHNLHYNDCVVDGLRHRFDGVTDALRHCFDSLVDVLMHYEVGGESEDKFMEKQATSMQFSRKIVENQSLEGSKIVENRCLEVSWGSWRVLGRLRVLWLDFGRFFWRHWGEDGRNMSEVGAKLAASCVQDGPC